jgi:hypothetical protein
VSTLTDTDDLLTLSEIAKRIPGARGARRLHPATITRWILKGTKATDGSLVRLRATRVGYRWLVRAGDLEEFFRTLSAPVETTAVPTVRAPAARRKASDRAAAKLKEMGA